MNNTSGYRRGIIITSYGSSTAATKEVAVVLVAPVIILVVERIILVAEVVEIVTVLEIVIVFSLPIVEIIVEMSKYEKL